MDLDASTVILNGGYTILLVSTFTRTILWLRAVLICSSIAFVAYGITSGITAVAIWNSLTGALHVYQLVVYIRARKAITMDPEGEMVHRELFAGLDRFDFATMWSLGEPRTYEDEPLTIAGRRQDRTALILDGQVEVSRNGEVLAVLCRGELVGELSYVSGQPASADARAVGPVRVQEWEQGKLQALDALNPAAGKAFDRYLLGDIALKAGAGEGATGLTSPSMAQA